MVHSKRNFITEDHSGVDLHVAKEVCKCFRDNKDNYTDFTVNVGDTKFKCHRFVLSSCSGFFEALMRTDMREKSESSCTIHGITPEIFGLILDVIYKGKHVLNDDNMLAMWHASNQLQIKFLFLDCEKFISERVTLQNYWVVYINAKLLDSFDVITKLRPFFVVNFVKVVQSDVFMQLSLDDLKFILNHCACRYCRPDFVVQSVLKWTCSDDCYHTNEPNKSASTPDAVTGSLKSRCRKVNSTTNERGDLPLRRSYLGQLLALTPLKRTSNAYLAKLRNNRFVMENLFAMTLVNNTATTRSDATKELEEIRKIKVLQELKLGSYSSESTSEDESDTSTERSYRSDSESNGITNEQPRLGDRIYQTTIERVQSFDDLTSNGFLDELHFMAIVMFIYLCLVLSIYLIMSVC